MKIMSIIYKEIHQYKTYGKAILVSNGKLEFIATLDIGPRVMHVSLVGMPSVLEDECPLKTQLPDGKTYNFFGGHRIWHNPEAFPRSYMPDNEPLESYEMLKDGILLTQKEEPWTHMKKSLEVRFEENGIRIRNLITNLGAWPVEFAIWSLSIGSRDGREVCPIVQRETGFLPNKAFVSWPYSRMNDPRVHWGQRYVVVDQNRDDYSAFKFGYANELGWVAYFVHGQCFVKTFNHDQSGKYPDMNTSYQTYSSYWGVELESLSPLKQVKPSETYTHEEKWYIVASDALKSTDEDEITALLKPIAEVTGIELPVVAL